MALSSDEDFAEALEFTARHVESGVILWRLRPSEVEARIDAQRLEKEPDQKKIRKCIQILRSEISILLGGVLSEVSARTIASYPMLAGPTPSEKDTELVKTRLGQAEAALASPALRQRYLIRSTAKGKVLKELRWDISAKRHDYREGTIDPLYFATLEFITAPSSAFSLFPLPWIFDTASESTMFDVHSDDLDEIIRDLVTIRDNLRQLGSDKPDEPQT